MTFFTPRHNIEPLKVNLVNERKNIFVFKNAADVQSKYRSLQGLVSAEEKHTENEPGFRPTYFRPTFFVESISSNRIRLDYVWLA